MPLYEYQCEACGERFEAIQKFSDSPIEVCRKCGKGPVRKLQSSPAFQFKGSGWYITDYAKKSSSEASSSNSESKSDGKADGKSESKGESNGESKTETKTESKSETKTEAKTP